MRFSQTSPLSGDLEGLERMIRYFVDCPSIASTVMFSSYGTGAVGVRRKTAKVKHHPAHPGMEEAGGTVGQEVSIRHLLCTAPLLPASAVCLWRE